MATLSLLSVSDGVATGGSLSDFPLQEIDADVAITAAAQVSRATLLNMNTRLRVKRAEKVPYDRDSTEGEC